MAAAIITSPTTSSGELLDKRIEFAERKVLMAQARLLEHQEKANKALKRLDAEARNLEEMKKEWIRKRNVEQERVRQDAHDIKVAHRHTMEDLRVKYERERENKLRDIKVVIAEREKAIQEWQKKRSEALLKTKAEESEINARYQGRINELLKEQQSSIRRGVVRQRRFLDNPNVYSMSLERPRPIGMKKRPYSKKTFGI